MCRRLSKIFATCIGGHFNLAQKVLQYNPTLHCFCCSALYYAPIPLSFHISYSRSSSSPLQLHTTTTTHFSRSWADPYPLTLEPLLQAKGGNSDLFMKGDKTKDHVLRRDTDLRTHRIASRSVSTHINVTWKWTNGHLPKSYTDKLWFISSKINVNILSYTRYDSYLWVWGRKSMYVCFCPSTAKG